MIINNGQIGGLPQVFEAQDSLLQCIQQVESRILFYMYVMLPSFHKLHYTLCVEINGPMASAHITPVNKGHYYASLVHHLQV